MLQGIRVAVVIPAYQEERLLPQTLCHLPTWIDEVIVIDDASIDRTSEVAWESAVESMSRSKNMTSFHVLRCEHNGGVGRAITLGYLAAQRLNTEVAVVVGADAQMDPNEMESLIQGIIRGADYVKGERFSHPEVRSRMPWVRYWGNRVLSKMTGYIAGDSSLPDAQCGYTALRLSWLARIQIEHLYPRYGFPNDLLLRLINAGAKVQHLPVTPIYESECSKLSIPRVVIPLTWLLFRAALRRAALRGAALLGKRPSLEDPLFSDQNHINPHIHPSPQRHLLEVYVDQLLTQSRHMYETQLQSTPHSAQTLSSNTTPRSNSRDQRITSPISALTHSHCTQAPQAQQKVSKRHELSSSEVHLYRS